MKIQRLNNGKVEKIAGDAGKYKRKHMIVQNSRENKLHFTLFLFTFSFPPYLMYRILR